MNNQLLSLEEAAKILKVHPETLRRWDREGKLKAIKIGKRRDRRYRESDILEYTDPTSSRLKYARDIPHNNHHINWYSKGFTTVPRRFEVIAKLTVHAPLENETSYFAFFATDTSSFRRVDEGNDLDDLATSVIKDCIDNQKISDESMHTFEFINGTFEEVQNPEWWKGKYSKTLTNGLRLEAKASHAVTHEEKAWRVILQFKAREGGYWLTNTFGANRSMSEYFVWIVSGELLKKRLPNTAKGAEILAMTYGIKRFEETKDSDGVRDITRISENNAACYNGKCLKNRLLPEKYTSLSHRVSK